MMGHENGGWMNSDQQEAVVRVGRATVDPEDAANLRTTVGPCDHLYGEQLDAVAAQLMRVHPIAVIKAIGRMDCAEAAKEIAERILASQVTSVVAERIMLSNSLQMARQYEVISQLLAACEAAEPFVAVHSSTEAMQTFVRMEAAIKAAKESASEQS